MWTSEIDNKFLLTPQTAIIKNIVYEILRECDKRDFVAEKKFVTFLVHLVYLQFHDEIDFNEKFDRNTIEKLIGICLRLIIDLNETPSNITLKMQVFFIENSKPYDEIVAECRENLSKKTSGLVREIVDGAATAKTKDELIIIQKKIVVDIILHAALGSPSNQEVVAEVTQALNSIMTESDLENFTALELHNRVESLKEIRMIVCGIVLFNKDTGIGNTMDENIPDLPKTLVKSYDSIESLLQFTLCDIMDRVNILTTVFDDAVKIENCQLILIGEFSKASEIEILTDLLILNRQHEIYVRKLLNNLKFVKSKIELRVKNYAEKLAKLHELVQFRSAVPSVQIFPKFKDLSEEWMALHNLSYVLSQQSQINSYLQHLSELCRQQQFDEIVHKLLGENQVETDHTRLQKRCHLKLSEATSSTSTPASAHVSIVQPPESNCEIEYLGFCTFVLAESGVLLPSVPEMGAILWNKKIYGFYSIEAAESFMAQPKKFINKIFELLKANVQLILFFDIFNAIKLAKFKPIDLEGFLQENQYSENQKKKSVEVEIQTELHPVPAYKDEKYVWNLWDLRRKAIELADLRRKKTTSSQTAITYHRLDIAQQRYESRQKSLQTNESKESNTN